MRRPAGDAPGRQESSDGFGREANRLPDPRACMSGNYSGTSRSERTARSRHKTACRRPKSRSQGRSLQLVVCRRAARSSDQIPPAKRPGLRTFCGSKNVFHALHQCEIMPFGSPNISHRAFYLGRREPQHGLSIAFLLSANLKTSLIAPAISAADLSIPSSGKNAAYIIPDARVSVAKARFRCLAMSLNFPCRGVITVGKTPTRKIAVDGKASRINFGNSRMRARTDDCSVSLSGMNSAAFAAPAMCPEFACIAVDDCGLTCRRDDDGPLPRRDSSGSRPEKRRRAAAGSATSKI